MPWEKVDKTATYTPNIKRGRRPYRDISNETGNVDNIDITNIKDKGKVDNQATGASILPTNAVLIIFTFIVVIERACAQVSLSTFL